jgi:hypothetical protein
VKVGMMCSRAGEHSHRLACRGRSRALEPTYGIAQSRDKKRWKPSPWLGCIKDSCVDVGKRTSQSRFGAELVDVLNTPTKFQHGRPRRSTFLLPVLQGQSFETL